MILIYGKVLFFYLIRKKQHFFTMDLHMKSKK